MTPVGFSSALFGGSGGAVEVAHASAYESVEGVGGALSNTASYRRGGTLTGLR